MPVEVAVGRDDDMINFGINTVDCVGLDDDDDDEGCGSDEIEIPLNQ